MATTAGRGILALGVIGMLLVSGAILATVVDPFAREPVTVDPITEWSARLLLVLGAAWLGIGMVAARTRLVRRPGAAAARATWIASTRPWRARESSLGLLPLDRWLMILVPAGVLVGTRVVQSPRDGLGSVALAVLGWLAFAVAVRLLLGRRSPWPVIAAVGGAIVMRCVVALTAISLSGPDGFWPELWSAPAVRILYLTVAFALVAWVFVVAGWSLAEQLGRRRATGVALAGMGVAYALPAVTIAVMGAGDALRSWNERIGILPWDLARLAGGRDGAIPLEAVVTTAVVATVVMLVGILLAFRAPTRGRAV
ncbi:MULTISPECIES: hypothetical protein [Microbacterium]|uniref:hypothetical protein n=1 Tax=Microbacterium TaxID=33882 RepID=UPI00277EC284|nr:MULTISPECIES: hypothetical protein [Microbacterium]MDQ1083073.1 hypothetical protein [Microbacterium sp. SORGH_AS_0344]MDQ1171655.1 hypothetical protein [Microbacterium proteolyticum]